MKPFKYFALCMIGTLLALSGCKNNENEVVDEDIHPTSILLTASKNSIFLDESVELEVTFNPINTTNKNYTYTISPSDIGAINNDIFTPLYAGNCLITATSEDGNLSSSISVEILENYASSEEVINSLKESEFMTSETLNYEENSLGLSNSNEVGVNENKLHNEELYPVPSEAKVYKASDYNITKDGINNAGNLTNLINSLVDVEGVKVIEFEDETYKFSNSITINKVNDLYLVGKENTKFVYDGWMSYLIVSQTTNFHVNSIKFDMDPSPTISGTILKVEEADTTATITIQVYDEFDISNERYALWNAQKTGSYAEYYYDETYDAYVPDRSKNLYYNPGLANLRPITNNQLEVTLNKNFGPSPYKTPTLGTVVSVGFMVYEYFGFSLSDCNNTYFEDVTSYVSAGMGIRADKGKNLYLNRFNYMREIGTNRLLTCTADIVHTCALEGDLVITNSILEGSHDDALNIKSFYTKISSFRQNVITVNQTQSEVVIDYDVNDIIDIYEPTTIGYKDTFTVLEVSKNGSSFDLTLDRNLPRGSNSYLNYLVGNVTKATHMRLENSVIKNKRNRGILLQGRDSVIKNCTFMNVVMGAVQVLGVEDTFKEAIVPNNVKIYNTKFLQCYDDLSIFTYGSNGSIPNTLKNVDVYNNFFYKGKGTTLWIRGSGDLDINNNLFYESDSKTNSIVIDDSIDIRVNDNYTLFDNVNTNYNLVYERSNTSNVSISGNVTGGR